MSRFLSWPAAGRALALALALAGVLGAGVGLATAQYNERQVRRIINLQGLIGDSSPPARAELPVGYLAGEPLGGPPDWWVETLAGFVDDGFDTLIFWPVDTVPEQVELLARDVVPPVRRSNVPQADG